MLDNLGVAYRDCGNGTFTFIVPSELVPDFYKKIRTIEFILHYDNVFCSAIDNEKWIFIIRGL